VRPRSLAGRIVAAFVVLSVASWLAIGATMFVALRVLHAESKTSALGDITQTIAFRFQDAAADRELRQTVNQVRAEVAGSSITVHVIRANGSLLEITGDVPDPSGPVVIPADARRGEVVAGTIGFSDGQPHLYAATVLSAPGAGGPRAVLLSTVDRSGADALRDVLRALPIVILVTLLIGVPLAVLLARSVTGPLRRLAGATARLPTAGNAPFSPLPLDGPTEIRELTDRFNAMSAELAATREREMELLANLRHDLRTPLTVITGFAMALTDGTATGDDATDAARAIAEEASRLERLVAELGTIERLRAGMDGLHPEPTDASEVIRAATDRFGATAAAAGVTLEYDDGAQSGPALTVDRLALERIVANLVGNAIAAAGPDGNVRIAARSVAGEGAAPAVAFSVSDDGPGFPPGGVERAFERFYRGDPARTGQGSGLGLAIVLDLARAHGGSAHAENLSPRGARVSVVLPVVPRIAPDVAPREH
jgi:two-component system, OmpR family, sensor kinase